MRRSSYTCLSELYISSLSTTGTLTCVSILRVHIRRIWTSRKSIHLGGRGGRDDSWASGASQLAGVEMTCVAHYEDGEPAAGARVQLSLPPTCCVRKSGTRRVAEPGRRWLLETGGTRSATRVAALTLGLRAIAGLLFGPMGLLIRTKVSHRLFASCPQASQKGKFTAACNRGTRAAWPRLHLLTTCYMTFLCQKKHGILREGNG